MKRLLQSKTFWELLITIPTILISSAISVLIIMALIKYVFG